MLKTVFLIAVTSGKRVSELQALGQKMSTYLSSRIGWSYGQYRVLILKFLVNPLSQKPGRYLPLRIRTQVHCKNWTFP